MNAGLLRAMQRLLLIAQDTITSPMVSVWTVFVREFAWMIMFVMEVSVMRDQTHLMSHIVFGVPLLTNVLYRACNLRKGAY